jgi:hypothetical protein
MDNRPIPQDEWIARSSLRFFKRLEAPLLVSQTVGLSNEGILRILRDHFEIVSRDAYYISIVARDILADKVSEKIYQEEEVLKAEREVFKSFEHANDYFDTRIKQAEQVLNESGGMDLGIKPGTVKLFETWCTTRTATKWLELLKKADHYLTLNYRLWVLGELVPANATEGEALAAKLNNERGARGELAHLRRSLAHQFSTIRNLVNRVNAQRETELEERRREQSERDKILKERPSRRKAKAAAATNTASVSALETA